MKYIFFNLKILAVFAAFFTVNLSADAQLTGDGSEGNPYKINTAVQLAQLATYINDGTAPYADAGKHYQLENDIDLSEYGAEFNDGQGWIPIGNNWGIRFNCFFDGNHKTVTGLWINNWSLTFNGLFGYIDNGIVKNLNVINAWVNSSRGDETDYAGIIAGVTSESSVINCYTSGYIISGSYGANTHVGGIVGQQGQGNISNCYSNVSVNGCDYSEQSYAGGIVGVNNGSVSNCYSIGEVNSSAKGDSYAGGIAGSNGGTGIVSNCYSKGSISSISTVTPNNTGSGGIIGINVGSVLNCYSICSINGTANNTLTGGIVGWNFGNVLSCVALNPGITGSATGAHYVGRVAGANYDGILSGNIGFNEMLNPDGETTWNNIGTTQIDGENITIEAIHADGAFGGRFSNANGWTTENGKLPGLSGTAVDMPPHLGGSGITVNSIFQSLNAYYKDGVLHISGLISGESLKIYNLAGMVVYENHSTTGANLRVCPKTIPNGIYIVQSGNRTTKTVVSDF